MKLRFTSPFERDPGIIEWLLNESYAQLVKTEPEVWEAEKENWKQTDRGVFDNPHTIGRCTRLSWFDGKIVGFFCYDPRPRPAYGVIGHNCILPEFRRNGFGKMQIVEIFRRFREMEICQARVSTNDHPFFIPAQRMYISCGFTEVKRTPWDSDSARNNIYYEIDLENKASHSIRTNPPSS